MVSCQCCGLLGLSDAVDPLLFVEGIAGLEVVALQLTSASVRNSEEVLRCEEDRVAKTTEDRVVITVVEYYSAEKYIIWV